jgi:hypothetical protein
MGDIDSKAAYRATHQQIDHLLEPGEKVIWTGVGHRRPRANAAALVMAISGLGLSLFSMAMIWMLCNGAIEPSRGLHQASFFYAGSAAFVTMLSGGIFLLITGVSEIGERRLETHYYGLTDQRVLFFTDESGQNANALHLYHLPEIRLQERTNGVGTIVFGLDWEIPAGFWNAKGCGPNYRVALSYAPRFENIPDARSVYKLIQKATVDARWGLP